MKAIAIRTCGIDGIQIKKDEEYEVIYSGSGQHDVFIGDRWLCSTNSDCFRENFVLQEQE